MGRAPVPRPTCRRLSVLQNVSGSNTQAFSGVGHARQSATQNAEGMPFLRFFGLRSFCLAWSGPRFGAPVGIMFGNFITDATDESVPHRELHESRIVLLSLLHVEELSSRQRHILAVAGAWRLAAHAAAQRKLRSPTSLANRRGHEPTLVRIFGRGDGRQQRGRVRGRRQRIGFGGVGGYVIDEGRDVHHFGGKVRGERTAVCNWFQPRRRARGSLCHRRP